MHNYYNSYSSSGVRGSSFGGFTSGGKSAVVTRGGFGATGGRMGGGAAS